MYGACYKIVTYPFCITCFVCVCSVAVISGGQRRVCAFAQRAGECGGQTQPGRGRERAPPTEDHRGGDFQTGAAQRAGEDQRGEGIIVEMMLFSPLQLVGRQRAVAVAWFSCDKADDRLLRGTGRDTCHTDGTFSIENALSALAPLSRI